jgi:predicted ferric reductase
MKLTPGRLSAGALAALLLHIPGVFGDGTGFIGYGKTLYYPTCAFACRGVVKNCKLSCTPEDSSVNHGTAHNPVSTPPDCFVRDDAFLRTMALCIDNYCPISDNPPLDVIEDYWASHLGTGTLGNYAYVPAVSYRDALAAARADEQKAFDELGGTRDHSQHGGDGHHHHKSRRGLVRRGGTGFVITPSGPNVTSALPHIKAKQALNQTSFILPQDWQLQYSGMYDFEYNEVGHSTYTLVVFFVAIFLPIPLSLIRFVPQIANSKLFSAIQSALIHPPFMGTHHRVPLFNLGTMPTRGQALYIFLISILNLIFLLAPYVHHHPQSTFGSLAEQTLSIIGNRAGVMAMGNVAAAFLFAARNNPLLIVADWTHATYLLLHRWLAYWGIFLAALHSVMLLDYYKRYGNYAAELARDYWVWGIVATVVACAMVPASLLVVRQKVYELFLGMHVVLAVLFLVGYYYHIWYCYTHNWGYEIWAYIAGGVWGAERVLRVLRVAWTGWRTAEVRIVRDTEDEYVVIEVSGRNTLPDQPGGVAYLSFPTLGWRVWESHPFSVAFVTPQTQGASTTASDSEGKEKQSGEGSEKQTSAAVTETPAQGKTVFLARVRSGMTARLAKKAASIPGGVLRLGVFIDGPYEHSGYAGCSLSRCSDVVYIAGGVGITGVLSYIRNVRLPSRLYWGVRREGLLAEISPALEQVKNSGLQVEVETSVGQRLDIEGILRRALVRKPEEEDKPVGIVVCGPPEMADQVRAKVVQLARSELLTRTYVFVDEAFGW